MPQVAQGPHGQGCKQQALLLYVFNGRSTHCRHQPQCPLVLNLAGKTVKLLLMIAKTALIQGARSKSHVQSDANRLINELPQDMGPCLAN